MVQCDIHIATSLLLISLHLFYNVVPFYIAYTVWLSKWIVNYLEATTAFLLNKFNFYAHRLFLTQTTHRAVANPPANTTTASMIEANSGVFRDALWMVLIFLKLWLPIWDNSRMCADVVRFCIATVDMVLKLTLKGTKNLVTILMQQRTSVSHPYQWWNSISDQRHR